MPVSSGKNRTCDCVGYEIKDGVCIIPDGKKIIEYRAFMNRTELKEVVIPESVETINPLAFYGCTSLTKITLPDSVENIEFWPSGVSSISMSKPFTELIDVLVNKGYRVQLKEDSWHYWD